MIELRPRPAGAGQQPRGWAVLAICLTMGVAVSANSLVNVALPSIMRDFGLSAAAVTWVVNAYQIGLVAMLLPLSFIGEIIGAKRVYIGGLALLILASALAAATSSFALLCALRALQGCCAAAIMAINGAMLRDLYAPAALGRGISYNAMVVAVVGAVSPAVAGAILSIADWRWLFLLNLPFGIAAIILGIRVLPSRARRDGRVDQIDVVLNLVAFGMLFLGMSGLGKGQGGQWTVLPVVFGSGAFLLLWRRSIGNAKALLPIDLLRDGLLRSSYATSFFAFTAQTIALVALPFYLQIWLHIDPFHTGLLLSLWPIAIIVSAWFAGRLVERRPPAVISSVGLLLFGTGLAMIGALPLLPVAGFAMAGLLVCGAGFGMFATPNNQTMIGAAPVERTVAAAAMTAQVRVVGQTSGAAMVSMVFALAGPVSHAGFVVAVLCAVVAMALSWRRRPSHG